MKKICLLLLLCYFFSCSKKLDLRPDSSLVLPESVQDMENLLDNTQVMNLTTALPQLSADEYYIPSTASFESLATPITRAAYIWQSDIFEGKTQIRDWTDPYAQIFICNNVLDVLSKQNSIDATKKQIKGWALFGRAYAFYTLLSTFSKAYEPGSATNDLGIPLKLTSAVTELVKRNTVQQSYDQVINDALEASDLLSQDIPRDKRNRPSKVAAFALLARVFLSMRQYEKAEFYVDKSLSLYNKLIDYNTLSITPTSSFTYNSEETLYFSQNNNSAYGQTTYSSNGLYYNVDTTLMQLYEIGDLRKEVYFKLNANGSYAVSKGINSSRGLPFTGLATDEMYLIKAECLARRDQKDEALTYLNNLVKTRMKTGSYIQVTATNSGEALEKVLIERRKALIWRCLRWTDLKRFNLEGRQQTLIRKLGNETYSLEPNSPKYILPIPDDEVTLSGIQQNPR